MRASHTPLMLRITTNIVVIVTIATLGGHMTTPGYAWTFGILWPYAQDHAGIWLLGSAISDLLVVSLAMILLAEWHSSTLQLRRVILGGLSGIIVMVVLGALLAGWMQVEFAIIGEGATTELGFIDWMPRLVDSSTQVFLWLGLTMGVWAGLRWPERLWLPVNFRANAQSIGFERSLTALVPYCVLGLIIYFIVSLAIVTLTYE